MSVKEVVPRALARRDIEEAIDHYLEEAGGKAALGFIDQIERAFRHIACRPAAGSPRYAHELDLPGLRAWPVKRYPYLVFYVEREHSVDVWRVLHGKRDVPAWIDESGTG